MNTKTRAFYGFYTHLINKIIFSVKAKTLIVLAITLTQAEAGTPANSPNFTDEDPPIIVITVGACESAVKDTISLVCYGHIILTADATDNETLKEDLLFSYKLDLFNDGIGAHSGYDFLVSKLSRREFNSGGIPVIHNNSFADNENNSFDASGTYPIGIHKICWYVTDTSGNTGALCQLFEIKDCKAPTPYCLTGVITVPLPSTGCLTIWAEDFNKGSFDNCTSPENLKFYFNGDPTALSTTICCEDFGAAGAGEELFVDIQMWVEDEEGNTDYCKTVIIVQDKLNVCDSHPHFPGRISGQIFSIKDRKDIIPAKNVYLLLLKDGNGYKQLTTSGGNYLFGDLPPGKYTLKAEKDDEAFEYVSTYDMIRTQLHILGAYEFDNPYQKIDADVNKNNSITAADISQIKKLILREIDRFNSGQTWFVFPSITPAPMSFSSSFEFEIKNYERITQDFRAIKIGDVNDLISSDSDRLLIPNPNDSLVFKIYNNSFKTGDTIQIDFYSNNLVHILGYQYTIKFDTQHLKFLDILENNLPTSTNNNFGTRYADNGFVTTSWVNLNTGQSFSDRDILYTFQFIGKQDGNLCDLVSITSDLTPAETYRDSFLIKNIKLDCDLVIKTNDETHDLCKVYPNPFQDEIHFHFSESVKFPVDIEIISLEGKRIALQHLKNEIRNWTWLDNQLRPGVYMIHISDSKNNVYLKMIKD
jgi:hypothetical protein